MQPPERELHPHSHFLDAPTTTPPPARLEPHGDLRGRRDVASPADCVHAVRPHPLALSPSRSPSSGPGPLGQARTTRTARDCRPLGCCGRKASPCSAPKRKGCTWFLLALSQPCVYKFPREGACLNLSYVLCLCLSQSHTLTHSLPCPQQMSGNFHRSKRSVLSGWGGGGEGLQATASGSLLEDGKQTHVLPGPGLCRLPLAGSGLRRGCG